MATLAVISHRVGLHDLLTHLHLLQDTLRHQGAWGYLVYAALFIIATLCLIPGSLLVIAGGMLFGPLTGSLLSFAAATLASSLSFLIARWLGRDLLQRYVGHTTVFQAIERGIARSGCDFLILTRLVPLFPYNIQNYAYGLTAIRFWPLEKPDIFSFNNERISLTVIPPCNIFELARAAARKLLGVIIANPAAFCKMKQKIIHFEVPGSPPPSGTARLPEAACPEIELLPGSASSG